MTRTKVPIFYLRNHISDNVRLISISFVILGFYCQVVHGSLNVYCSAFENISLILWCQMPAKYRPVCTRRLRPLCRNGSISCHTCYEMEPRFTRSHQMDHPVSRLLVLRPYPTLVHNECVQYLIGNQTFTRKLFHHFTGILRFYLSKKVNFGFLYSG